MEVILLEDVANLGHTGDQVKVKNGYARNYLLPRGLAAYANARNAGEVKHRQQLVEAQVERRRKEAEQLIERLKGVEVSIPVLVGEEDRLFGAVTNRDIEAALALLGYRFDRRRIQLPAPIKSLGEHTVQVRVRPDVLAEITVFVVKKE